MIDECFKYEAAPHKKAISFRLSRFKVITYLMIISLAKKIPRSDLTMQQGTVMNSVFHLAYHVNDLEAARQFYGGLLGCQEGRSTETWVDFDFFGHQLSLHLGEAVQTERTGMVCEHRVPMPHMGVILDMPTWQRLAKKLTEAGIRFVIAPTVRFVGEPGEQATMFFQDPSGNAIEVKGFADFFGIYAA